MDALPARHGTVAGYKKAKCRCPACTAAWADAVARYRSRRAAREHLAGGPGSHTEGDQKRDAGTLAQPLVRVPTEAANSDSLPNPLKPAPPAPRQESAGSGLVWVGVVLVLVLLLAATWWRQRGQGPDRPQSGGWRPRW